MMRKYQPLSYTISLYQAFLYNIVTTDSKMSSEFRVHWNPLNCELNSIMALQFIYEVSSKQVHVWKSLSLVGDTIFGDSGNFGR